MGPILGPVARATYYVGVAMRWTVDTVAIPYRAVANRGSSRSSTSHRRVASTLSRITSRVAEIERSLLAAERQSLHSTEGDANARRAATEQLSADLVEQLSSPAADIRSRALSELGEIADKDTAVLILDGIQDPDPDVRCAAASAAGTAGQPSSVFTLILLLDDQAPRVRREAKRAIERIVGHRVKFDPAKGAAKRRQQIDDLKEWWKEERFSKLAADLETVYRT
jgi:HEAT repeat protein